MPLSYCQHWRTTIHIIQRLDGRLLVAERNLPNQIRLLYFEKANKAAFDLAQKEIEDTSGVVSTEEIRKLIKRAQRERYATNALAKTYKSKRDWVGYEGAIREALTLKRMETELKKLCETKHDHKDSQG